MGELQFLTRLVSGAQVQINANGYNRHGAGARFGITTVDFDLLYTISGSYAYLVNGEPLESPAGTLLLVAPGDEVSCVAAEDCRQLFCHFQLLDWDYHSLVFPVRCRQLPEESGIAPLFLREYEVFRSDGDPFPLSAVLRLAALDVLRLDPPGLGAFATANEAVMPPALTELLVYVNNHVSEPLTVRSLARRMNMDESYFCRYFTRYLRLSPSRYVARLRMEAARTLLFQTSLSLQEIAEQVGYSSAFVLSKKFRSWYGKSPTKYRNEVNGAGDSPIM